MRINELTNKLTTAQLATYYNTLRLVIDDINFSTGTTGDMPYVLVSDLFLDHETRISDNVTAIAENATAISNNATAISNLQPLIDDIDWTDATKVSSATDSSSFIRCVKRGKAIGITGKLTFDSIPSENTILFTLPSAFPNFTETHYFASWDGALGRSDELCELKALAGSKNIVMGGGGSNGTEQYVSMTIWL